MHQRPLYRGEAPSPALAGFFVPFGTDFDFHECGNGECQLDGETAVFDEGLDELGDVRADAAAGAGEEFEDCVHDELLWLSALIAGPGWLSALSAVAPFRAVAQRRTL